jgi:SpoVK/Ycf46/Vps4 family AAA+-type ATPase
MLDRVDASAPPTGAVIVHPAATFEDLVVSEDVMSQLLEAASRLAHRQTVLERWGFLAGRPGREGLRLLFHGPPGTGKTLAGEVLAGALGRDLLIVDLSRIVSKWVGETEKNLAAIFESAERTGSALLFDEADALFGRRTEVGDARDRYANLETAYLLSRMERFEGLVVLATNLRQNLDGAFARRLDFIVGFPPPDARQRARLWRRLLPPDAPLDPAVDLGRLAALYAIPGGLIRSAAVSAGYLAAADGAVITTSHLVHAIRREYVKAGQHFPGEPPSSSGRQAAGALTRDDPPTAEAGQ